MLAVIFGDLEAYNEIQRRKRRFWHYLNDKASCVIPEVKFFFKIFIQSGNFISECSKTGFLIKKQNIFKHFLHIHWGTFSGKKCCLNKSNMGVIAKKNPNYFLKILQYLYYCFGIYCRPESLNSLIYTIVMPIKIIVHLLLRHSWDCNWHQKNKHYMNMYSKQTN